MRCSASLNPKYNTLLIRYFNQKMKVIVVALYVVILLLKFSLSEKIPGRIITGVIR